jgi:hypothetical protein
MGGMSSGRWGWHTKRQTVEEARTLDLSELARDGAFAPGRSGRVRWLRGETETASISYSVAEAAGGLVLTLHYTVTRTGEAVDISVRLETTRPRFGGVRWWGRWPCGRRVRKLYLPGGATRFACRQCHRLTYASAQEHDKRVDFLRKYPDALMTMLASGVGNLSNINLLLALKAVTMERKREGI